MIKRIDNVLNRITMYRLVVYVLGGLLAVATAFCAIGLLPYDPLSIPFSAAVIFVLCWIANIIFAKLFDAPVNPESTWITALILALLITPPKSFFDAAFWPLVMWGSAWAIASKYIVSYRGKHLFNPAAFGVAVTSLVLGLSASWWVGTAWLAPFALLGGLLIVRKMHRFDLWWAFMGVFTVGIIYTTFTGSDFVRTVQQSFLYAPVFFFSTVMLTEPLTMPPTRALRVAYGALIGFLFLPNVNIGGFYFTPDLALLAGNLFAFIVSPKYKLSLVLKDRIRLTADTYEFVFAPLRRMHFKAGQYMEWTLPHRDPDSRSVRRYFTIASAPDDGDVRLGVKFYSPASTFKKALLAMRPGDTIAAGGLSGDFTLPKSPRQPLVFIAGGIGITPFRSMIEHMLATKQRRNVTVLYANKTHDDVAYADLLKRAERELGVKTVHVFSDANISAGGKRIDGELIAATVPDYWTYMYYISGPQKMVDSTKEALTHLGIQRTHIKTDYFPGFA